jgi:hypothetical protein
MADSGREHDRPAAVQFGTVLSRQLQLGLAFPV